MKPEGDGSRPVECAGNKLAELTCECCLILHENDKELLFESSAPDGRYPKIWDLPSIQKLRDTTGAKVVAMSMCEWGLCPVDDAEAKYRKETWWLVSPGLYMHALALAKMHESTSMRH